ncbi:hypothetical protein E2C01_003706 [Portunus trituberculatus]|uniref:Uncharacterized protein n=1 Tax=Portunus trituberculatus TaxID=210409 RepID=A0A5B7CU87_PORTR|nr:hypothetical protein [Portunus trituberculatus]
MSEETRRPRPTDASSTPWRRDLGESCVAYSIDDDSRTRQGDTRTIYNDGPAQGRTITDIICMRE